MAKGNDTSKRIKQNQKDIEFWVGDFDTSKMKNGSVFIKGKK